MQTPAFTRRAALALAAGSGFAFAAPVAAAPAAADAMMLGKAAAPVTLIEYASVTCSHCAAWDREVFPAFKKKYVDTGLVRYELRELTTPPARLASAGFLLARCAGPAKYFDVVHSLFRTQEELFRTRDARAWLLGAARVGGVTEAQAEQCISDQSALAALNERVDRHLAAGVRVTPTFVIGDTKLENEQTLAQLDAVIQPLLRKKRRG